MSEEDEIEEWVQFGDRFRHQFEELRDGRSHEELIQAGRVYQKTRPPVKEYRIRTIHLAEPGPDGKPRNSYSAWVNLG